MSETDLKRAVTRYLELSGWLVTRVQSGGYRGRMRLAKTGTEDIVCMAPGGRYVAIEVKLPGEKLRPGQVNRCDLVQERGGDYFVVASMADAKWCVEQMREGTE